MSRRDTIIVAVLINASLMVMLFISALKKDTRDFEDKVVKVQSSDSKARVNELDKTLPLTKVSPVAPEIALKAAAAEHKPVEKSVVSPAKEVTAPTPAYKIEPKSSQEVKKPEIQKVEFIEHVVKKGDVLEKIAKNYQTSVEEIIQLNRLTSTQLQIGQHLKLPKTSQKSISKEKTISPEDFYIVKNGDNLWKIALEHQLKVEDLLKLNQLDEKKAKALRPGDQLRIR